MTLASIWYPKFHLLAKKFFFWMWSSGVYFERVGSDDQFCFLNRQLIILFLFSSSRLSSSILVHIWRDVAMTLTLTPPEASQTRAPESGVSDQYATVPVRLMDTWAPRARERYTRFPKIFRKPWVGGRLAAVNWSTSLMAGEQVGRRAERFNKFLTHWFE